MPGPVDLVEDELVDWWDDAVAIAQARWWLTNRRQRVFRAGDLWAVQEVKP